MNTNTIQTASPHKHSPRKGTGWELDVAITAKTACQVHGQGHRGRDLILSVLLSLSPKSKLRAHTEEHVFGSARSNKLRKTEKGQQNHPSLLTSVGKYTGLERTRTASAPLISVMAGPLLGPEVSACLDPGPGEEPGQVLNAIQRLNEQGKCEKKSLQNTE